MVSSASVKLSDRAARGMVWLGAQTLVVKAINLLGNLVLAWLLAPDIFGVIGMAYTVTTFVDLIQQAGVNQVLIHRQTSYRTWLNPAFWMSVTTGFLASVAVLLCAPLAATAYGEPKLIGLVGVLAIAPPVRALALIPAAKLQIDMKFGLLAKTMVVTSILQIVIAVTLAFFDFGAYSVVLPVPVVEAARMATYWAAVRPRIKFELQWRRWRYLFSDTVYTLAAQFCYTVIGQGDYVILALTYSAGEMGLYYFAFNLSLQSLNIFTSNLAKVLFPALSQLKEDSPRQARAFITASRLLTLIVIPGCIFQAALADDFIHALYKPDWYGAAPLLRILSIALAFRAIGGSVPGLMMAQGRFKFTMNWAMLSMSFFLGLVLFGASFSVFGTAVSVLVYSIFIGPTGVYLAIRAGGGRWRDVWDIYALPLFASGIAAVAGWLVSRSIPEVSGLIWWRIATIVGVSVILYCAIVWWLAPDQMQEFRRRASGVFSRRSNRSDSDKKAASAPVV